MTHLRQGYGGQGSARLLLRAIAITIAIVGLIDPAWTVSRPPDQKLVAIRMTAVPAGDIEQALRANLPGWAIEPREFASRLPCGPDEHCVVIADGSLDAGVPDDLTKPLSLIAVRVDDGPNVAVRSVSVLAAHQSGAGVARVELLGTGVSQQRSVIRVLDGAAVIGSTAHQWTESLATVDVAWWPIESGARSLRIEPVPLEGERATIDNHIDVGVTVTATRSPVLVFDARPSWSSTFVRRALEDDARFAVGYRTRLAPSLSAGTANGRLDAAALDLASVVVIGGPDALTAGDVTLLEQFVGERGGTLVLLPERRPTGPWSRLLAGEWTEHLTATPEAVGPLHATEVLRADRPPLTATVLARSGSEAAILVLPSGNGRIVMAGAMDAWRYRDLNAGSFDTFWRSLIAEGAAWGEGLQLTFDRDLGTRGSRARFVIRDRRMVPAESTEASATARCDANEAAKVIRVWPSGPAGEFWGEVPLAGTGALARRILGEGGCGLEVNVNDRQAAGSIAVVDRPMFGVAQTLSKLERRVTSSGGVVASPGDEAALTRLLTSAVAPAAIAKAVHPMRAAWWMLPFAGCLSVEWWLRRRTGLR